MFLLGFTKARIVKAACCSAVKQGPDDDERLLRCGCRIPCWLGTGGSPWREPGRSAVRLRERALGERALPSRTSKDGVRSLPTLQTSPRLSVAGSQLRGNPRQEANP